MHFCELAADNNWTIANQAEQLLKRLTFVNDPVISEAMAMLHAEQLDGGLPH